MPNGGKKKEVAEAESGGLINVDGMLKRYVAIRDQVSTLNAQIDILKEEKNKLERKIIGLSETTGLTKIGSSAVVAHVHTAWRANYVPEQWEDIVKWAVKTGNLHLVQRRITDAKVLELQDQGVELPKGLTLEPYQKVSVRKA